ncbi:hypothetical protein AKJ41_02335 [candidate division MSBL1 archaeon SCGC-AAA259O05]|uniref:alpha-L-rhamnosidase n=1 Tax=candidate division MSBL1 archaeon SCGC-AAA259O05 TaxID=1698271 RepID=A0A133V467_9EURY|nr:hypothetical protein AKJ41_02335 [candidate division MSBL1 archaeon SCGC-AAA259O05]
MQEPRDLLCEYSSDPLGIDVEKPRFSWRLEHAERGRSQKAYRLIVASERSELDPESADLWDSGKVVSEKSVNIEYDGRPLESVEKYYWKVKWWDDKGRESAFSETATFLMGPMKSDDWEASWIGDPAERPGYSSLFRKEFELEKGVETAQVYVAGIGYHELRINGEKADDRVLDPGHTEYGKRVLYSTYEVADLLEEDSNVIGVLTGNGWYGKQELFFQMTIKLTDGTEKIITSEQPWMVASGPILQNSIYDGEVYDARLEKTGWDIPGYRDKVSDEVLRDEWTRAVHVEGPGGELESQKMEPIRVNEVVKPVDVSNPEDEVYVFDLGQNITGWAEISVDGERGREINLKYGEVVDDEGRVNQDNLRSARAKDTYILSGDETEKYEPRFTYHGFRYVEVEGLPEEPEKEDLLGKFVHSGMESASDFRTSNELINQIQENTVRGTRGNLHSIPTDCPQRNERLGWLGDNTIYAEEAIYNFDMVKFYTKWLKDIRDAQDEETGAVPDTAPYRWGRKPGDPGWGSCYVLLPWFLYLYYGDTRVLERHYEGMKRWVDYMKGRSKVNLLRYTYYGDWCPPEDSCLSADESPAEDSPGAHVGAGAYPKNTPGILVSTWWYYYSAMILSEIAKILGKTDDMHEYSELADEIEKAFNDEFLNEEEGIYAEGSQTSLVLPLFLQMVPKGLEEKVVGKLVENIREEHNGHLDTGIVGTKYLLPVLSEYGREELAYNLATQKSYPSWGYMIENGATTIWERWEYKTGGGMNSHNHPMLGSISEWFHKYLAGIRPDSSAPGFKRVRIEPSFVEDLDFVSDSVETPRGPVKSIWKKNSGSIHLKVSIPVNGEAEIKLHKTDFEEGISIVEEGETIWKKESLLNRREGIIDVSEKEECVILEIGSGEYSFRINEL